MADPEVPPGVVDLSDVIEYFRTGNFNIAFVDTSIPGTAESGQITVWSNAGSEVPRPTQIDSYYGYDSISSIDKLTEDMTAVSQRGYRNIIIVTGDLTDNVGPSGLPGGIVTLPLNVNISLIPPVLRPLIDVVKSVAISGQFRQFQIVPQEKYTDTVPLYPLIYQPVTPLYLAVFTSLLQIGKNTGVPTVHMFDSQLYISATSNIFSRESKFFGRYLQNTTFYLNKNTEQPARQLTRVSHWIIVRGEYWDYTKIDFIPESLSPSNFHVSNTHTPSSHVSSRRRTNGQLTTSAAVTGTAIGVVDEENNTLTAFACTPGVSVVVEGDVEIVSLFQPRIFELTDQTVPPDQEPLPLPPDYPAPDNPPIRSSNSNLITGEGAITVSRAASSVQRSSLGQESALAQAEGKQSMSPLIVSKVPLAEDQLLAYGADTDIIYVDDTGVSPAMLANTCRYSFMEGDFDGLSVPLTTSDLRQNLDEGCLAPDPEGDALLMGIVSGNQVQTPGQRTAYCLVQSDTTLTFQDRNIIYVDASAGNVTVTLPVSDDPNTDGRLFTIKQVNFSSACGHRVRITSQQGATIDGYSCYTLTPIRKRCKCGHSAKVKAPAALRLQYAMGQYQIL